MRKRTRAHKKAIHTHSKRRIPKHLHYHMIFIYSSMGVFGLTLIFAVMHTVLAPFAAQNTIYYSTHTTVLGASSTNQELLGKGQSLFSQFLHILLPNMNK